MRNLLIGLGLGIALAITSYLREISENLQRLIEAMK